MKGILKAATTTVRGGRERNNDEYEGVLLFKGSKLVIAEDSKASPSSSSPLKGNEVHNNNKENEAGHLLSEREKLLACAISGQDIVKNAVSLQNLAIIVMDGNKIKTTIKEKRRRKRQPRSVRIRKKKLKM